MFQYEAEIIRWVDGDTVWLNIDLGFYTHRETDIRLARINTPERIQYTVQGLQDQVKIHNEQACPVGSVCVVEITKRDKYGRWLGEIRYLPGSRSRDDILSRGTCLNDELLVKGLAQPYKK
jgi:micrococcal nuclease